MFINNGSHRDVKPFIRGAMSLFVLSMAILLIHEFQGSKAGFASHPSFDGRIRGGSLVIAGGGYVSSDVRQRFVDLAGGSEARIVVIPATDPAPGKEDSWLNPWRELGVEHVELCNAHDRATANTPGFCAALNRATGVWFSGGYQDLLAQRYVDTAVQKCLMDVLHRNGVVGGCSAGAAILSRVMIQEGEMTPVEARGLDLIPDAIVDQHFLQRNRLWRMQQILELHPNLVGIGVDENTALVFEITSGRLSVLGESYAMICIPPSGGHSSRFEVLKSGDNVLLSQLRKEHLAFHFPKQPVKPPTPSIAFHAA